MKESDIEQHLIDKLQELKYTYRKDINSRKSLEDNFREKFDELNRVTLSDNEFERLKLQIIQPDVFEASTILRSQNTLKRDDDTPLHYTLVNLKDWCKNSFEVIHQLKMNTAYSNHRYDVILLINGIPVVQIELKSLEISPRRAMQQIVNYKNDEGNSYHNSLLCFMQLFIVSNRTNTLYFANNNAEHFSFDADERFLPIYQFAERDNSTKIKNLFEFADKFLSKCILGEMISRYMVTIASEKKLLMMRPYQIYAVKAIVEKIHKNNGNGYIWHTTGSGKTLTSFKASTLLKDNPDIDKCLFVVDRKDLDRQTREEFNKFQDGCVEENTNTETLVQRLLSDDYSDKVIVTTIQKLGLALDETRKSRGKQKNYKERLKPLQNKRIVFIFDECHRSQFGENHQAIKNFFPNSQLFGFTGTPIFEDNGTYKKINGEEAYIVETKDIFQEELHAYTITNAIEDRNVLRFHIDYYKPDENTNISTPTKETIVKTILQKHDFATANRKFNAVLATARIDDAIVYYKLFKQLQAEKQQQDASFKPLNIACVFSPPATGNQDIKQLQEDLEQEKEDNKHNPEEKKKALKEIISDYNKQYKTNYKLDTFDLYYQDIQKRIKDQQYSNQDLAHDKKVDIIIVVDMLLTGFDSKFLNTLYVDKNLKYHGLIQAFSRTNRVLNDTKPYGNILDFRSQCENVNKAIALFSGAEKDRAKEVWLVDPAPVVLEQLDDAVKKLDDFMTSQGLENKPEQVANIKGDTARAEFIRCFKEIQRLKTQLDQYTDLTADNKQTIDNLIDEESMRAFKGAYLDVAQRLKSQQDKKDTPIEKEVENLDVELVLFASAMIDYDYIMNLIANYTHATPSKQEISKLELLRLIASDSKFIDEKDDIKAYIDTLQLGEALNVKQIREGFEEFKANKSAQQITELAEKFGLEPKALQAFVDKIILRMIFDGEELTDLMEPLGLGWLARSKKETALMEELIPILKKLANGEEISGLDTYE
ncbi:type I restriction endonuclease subunit R [Francisella uliginis]|uniref:Type I restriction enzyme endonuclease subunit n=1 Tax=Francisella uliginis TaxID=573570 RepID=A0A1L4BQU3_9GAMM|nr:type I restriction endonuclease subunit R [Francisella uliginis]API86203.1 DEAD/DEAH box helicase [Francisella uliginis]